MGKKTGVFTKLDWFLLTLFIFLPRLLQLDLFLTADEPLFFKHALDFARGMAGGNFDQTLGIGYPGVTVAAVAAWPVSLTEDTLTAITAGRTAVALLNGTLLLVLYGLGRRLLGRRPAFIAVLLLAIDPFFLGYSRLLHNDALLSLFMSLTGLSLVHWLYGGEEKRWIVFTGLFAGLSVLTKSTALLLGPMLLTMLVGWAILNKQWSKKAWWLRVLSRMLAATAVATLVFFILWPAMWVSPVTALGLTFTKLLIDQEAGTGNLGSFWMGRFVQDPGPLFYPVVFLLKSTPWLLVGLLLSLIQPARSFLNQSPNRQGTIFSLWLFSLTYLLFMTIASKKTGRYLLPVIPFFYMLTGVAFYKAGQWFEQHLKSEATQKSLYKKLTGRSTVSIVLLLLVVFLSLFTFIYHPYYLTYHNPAVLGWRWAPDAFLVGWGEGLDQAAAYLNKKPPAQVSAWYNHLFQLFYKGQTEEVVPLETLLTEDYAVLYINQVQRNIPAPNLIHYFQTRRRPEHTVRINGIDYAWVYPGPVVSFRPDPDIRFLLGGEFGTEAKLLGYDLHPQPVTVGNRLIVTLYWRILTTPPAERFVYVRLVDARGRIWAQTDSPPVMGMWPVHRWQPDMLIEDAQALPIPAGTPPGTYQLEAGLYNPDSGRSLPATGRPLGQGGGLLLGQVTVDWQPSQEVNISPPQQEVKVALAPDIRLVGYTPPAPVAETGQPIPLEFIWQSTLPWWSSGSGADHSLVFEWLKKEDIQAKQREPLPLPVAQWGRGAVLRSQPEVVVPPHLATGHYRLQVSLYNGSRRAGERFTLGEVEVTAPPHTFEVPAAATVPSGPAQLAAGPERQIRLAGYTINQTDRELKLKLFWQPTQVITTPYKVFAQVLTPENVLVAQSDAVPAAGQRPTTGWLPAEVITDPHTLTLPADLPPGSYHLIVGLYNPVDGRRLPVIDHSGQIVADAITLN